MSLCDYSNASVLVNRPRPVASMESIARLLAGTSLPGHKAIDGTWSLNEDAGNETRRPIYRACLPLSGVHLRHNRPPAWR